MNLIFLLLISTHLLQAATWKKASTVLPTVTNKGTAGAALKAIECPTNYIFIPKLVSYTVVDFCVMKYEAKDDGYGTPVSIAANKPWVSIKRDDARSKCQSLGRGYDLISNDQWQTIARNIAGVLDNWNIVSSVRTELNSGYSLAGSSAGAEPADSNDSNYCKGTSVLDRTCDNTG